MSYLHTQIVMCCKESSLCLWQTHDLIAKAYMSQTPNSEE